VRSFYKAKSGPSSQLFDSQLFDSAKFSMIPSSDGPAVSMKGPLKWLGRLFLQKRKRNLRPLFPKANGADTRVDTAIDRPRPVPTELPLRPEFVIAIQPAIVINLKR
jgi:hypothetical protein